MLSPTRPIVYTICVLIAISAQIQGQNTNSNTNTSDVDTALLLYDSVFYNPLTYINGREYKPYHLPRNPNPYLNNAHGTGSIFIEGKEYRNKQLKYDLHKDKLIVIPNYFVFSNIHIEINKTKIDSFSINFDKKEFSFIQIMEKNNNTNLSPGFYQPIYHSENSRLLIKHYVILGLEDGITTYRHDIKRYLSVQELFHDITTKRKLLKLFHDQRKLVKRKIKSINPSYKKMTNHQLIQLIQFIDSI